MPKPIQEYIKDVKDECRCLDAHAAREFYDGTPGTMIIDVREPAEAEKGKLQQSINIPRGVLEMKITELCPDDDLPILLHCAAGGRAAMAAKSLQDMGYRNVRIIDAAFDEIMAAFP